MNLYPMSAGRSALCCAALLAFLDASSLHLRGAGDADKDYVVYFGLEVAVDERGTQCPVVAGSESEVAILRNGQRVNVPVRDARLKTAMEPKLGRDQLKIEDVKEARTYSPRSDPARDALAQQMVMATAQSQSQEAAEYQSNRAAENAESVQRAAAAPFSQVTQAQVAEANALAAAAAARLETSYASPIFSSALPGDFDSEGGDYDAFEINFRIAATETLENAFGVLRVLVRDPLNARQPMQVVRFFSLRNLEPKARKVSILQTGLPTGFSVDSYSVHIYANGTEVPTNLSKNRVELTRDEAHQFLILQHVQNHRGASLAAELLPGLVPPEVAALVPASLRGTALDFAIDRDGRVTRVSKSQGDATTLSPELMAALQRVCFLPAMLNGNPVDGLGTFALSELVP